MDNGMTEHLISGSLGDVSWDQKAALQLSHPIPTPPQKKKNKTKQKTKTTFPMIGLPPLKIFSKVSLDSNIIVLTNS